MSSPAFQYAVLTQNRFSQNGGYGFIAKGPEGPFMPVGQTPEEVLNDLGKTGWDLVSAFVSEQDSHSTQTTYVFKRIG